MRHQRKPAKARAGKASTPVPDIPLQEPILITDVGKARRPPAGVQHGPRSSVRPYCSSLMECCVLPGPGVPPSALKPQSWLTPLGLCSWDKEVVSGKTQRETPAGTGPSKRTGVCCLRLGLHCHLHLKPLPGLR